VVTVLRATSASSAARMDTSLENARINKELAAMQVEEGASSASRMVIWLEIVLTHQLMTPRAEVVAEVALVPVVQSHATSASRRVTCLVSAQMRVQVATTSLTSARGEMMMVGRPSADQAAMTTTTLAISGATTTITLTPTSGALLMMLLPTIAMPMHGAPMLRHSRLLMIVEQQHGELQTTATLVAATAGTEISIYTSLCS
jgi:hypothetical protein